MDNNKTVKNDIKHTTSTSVIKISENRKEKMATFWSTSRNELWIKGKTSGDYLEIVEICVNCEQNSILYRVIPKGKGACHTKDKNGRARTGCYYRTLTNKGKLEFREEIE